MRIATQTIPGTTRIPVQRPERPIHCPSCHTNGNTRATTVKCGGCGLVAPLSAFSNAASTQKFGQVRAFTISGSID